MLKSLGVAGDNAADVELKESLTDLVTEIVDDRYLANFGRQETDPELTYAEALALALAIADDDAPCHAPPTSPDVTEPKEAAAEANSMANPSQAVAAAAIGSGPAPANISAELISGGSTEKFIVQPSLRAPRDQR